MTNAVTAALLLLPFIAWRVIRSGLAKRGDSSDVSRQRALRYFSQEDIAAGKSHTQPYITPRLFGYLLNIAFLWAIIFMGGAQLFERIAVHATGSLALQTILFLLLYSAAGTIITLPVAVHSGYTLPKRLGSLKQTFGQWLLFQIKGFVLQTAFVWLLLYLLLVVVGRVEVWWPIVAGVFIGVALLVNVLHPLVLTKIFYRFSRLDDGPLRDRLLDICRKAGVSVNDIHIQHESTVTTHSNAYFSGIGKGRRIVLYDNLLNRHSEDEVALIVAHESGHWSAGHIRWSLIVTALSAILGAWLLYALFRTDKAVEVFGTDPSRLSILPVLALLGLIVGEFISPLASMMARKFERQADRISLELTDDPEAFINSHMRLVRDNKSDILPHPLLVKLYASHPPALERIAMAEHYRSAAGSADGRTIDE